MIEKSTPGKWRKIAALTAFPLFIISTLVVFWIFRYEIWELFKSPERIKEWVGAQGIIAPLTFVGLQILQVVVFIIPGEVPQIAGGYIFGMWNGILLSVIGILIGSVFNFYMARLLGVPFVRTLFGGMQLSRFDRIVRSPRAQTAFFLLFVIPGIPKDILCYVAGLSPITFPAFVAISTLGRLPGIVGSAGMGDAAASSRWLLAGSIAIGATGLFIAGLIFREKLHRLIERYTAKGRESED